jgi:hypothetical protein
MNSFCHGHKCLHDSRMTFSFINRSLQSILRYDGVLVLDCSFIGCEEGKLEILLGLGSHMHCYVYLQATKCCDENGIEILTNKRSCSTRWLP